MYYIVYYCGNSGKSVLVASDLISEKSALKKFDFLNIEYQKDKRVDYELILCKRVCRINKRI